MRDSADSDDYGVTRRGKKRGSSATTRPPTRSATGISQARSGRRPRRHRWPSRKATGVDLGSSTPTERGPKPHPKWLVTDLARLTTSWRPQDGKEADVISSSAAACPDRQVLPARRQALPGPTHRQSPGRRLLWKAAAVRESPGQPGRRNRSDFGRQAIAGSGRTAEFNALTQLYNARVPVPYPVQILGRTPPRVHRDSDGTGAPRLAETPPTRPSSPASGAS